MASNRPPEDELGQTLQRHMQNSNGPNMLNNPNIPILGRQQPKKRWRCPACKTIVEASPQPFQIPGQPPFYAPVEQIFTMLPGELVGVFLCSQCDVRVRRKLVPQLEEIDDNDNVIPRGLRVVPSPDEGEVTP